MASAETWTPSRRLRSAVLIERERAQRQLAELDRRYAELANALDRLSASRSELREQLSMLNRLVHDGEDQNVDHPRAAGVDDEDVLHDPKNDIDEGRVRTSVSQPAGTTLRGQAIREAAVRVLVSSPRAHDPIHYKEWFQLLRADGCIPAGKDPLATFLTQLSRSPVVTRTSAQGVYMLDHEFPARTRRKLEQLRQELRAAHDVPVGQGVADVVAARERRSKLVTEVERLERELEEALRSLAPIERPLRAIG